MAYIQPGHTITAAASRDVEPGDGMLIGTMFGVSLGTYVSGDTGEFHTCGVHELEKTSAQAWTVGAAIYWDNTNFVCTTTSTSNKLIGAATEAAANPSSTGRVRLNGVAVP